MSKHVGASVESLFEELGELQEVRLLAAKKILAEDLRRLMEAQRVSKVGLASRMATSRDVIYRLLDPADTSVTLATIVKAAAALGQECTIHVGEPAARPRARAAGRKKPARASARHAG